MVYYGHLPGPLDGTSIKNYPKDDFIQAVTMEEIKLAL